MSDILSSSNVEQMGIPASMPQVLSRNSIPGLTQDLDASDVLECYALVRSAPLHGIANSTIHIQKTAIGFRYRPPGGLLQKQHIDRRPIEMTLEYGPQRVGTMMLHEAMPYIQSSDQEYSFVGWENEGRIFYTTEIVTESYLSSYYMASMTGAVLNKILLQAVEYAALRRRYHPFSIFSAKNGREVRSSSSVDFAQYVWRQLANLGVEIHPILPPPVYEARLWVESWEKVVPAPSTSYEAAKFYQKLYQCLEAIATNDYAAYEPVALPTVSPIPASPTVAPTIAITGGRHHVSPPPVADATRSSSSPTGPPAVDAPDTSGEGDNNIPRNRTLRTGDAEAEEGEEDIFDDDGTDIVVDDTDVKHNPHVDDDSPSTLSATPSPTMVYPTILPAPVTADSVAPVVDPEDKVEEAKQAAADAQQAADEAKNAAQTEGDSKAADAAQSAATAAQAAVDATSVATGKAAMDGLLSGDGGTMTSIITQCLTREKYGIASVNENGTVTVNSFLYREGSSYYKLKMVAPYIEIAKINRALPEAVARSNVGDGGELIDYVLAFLVLSSILMLVIGLLQQIGFKCSKTLFRWQRWFFNPRKYDYEGNTLDDLEGLHNVEPGIPLSMGGRNSKVPPKFPRVPTPKTSRMSQGLESQGRNSGGSRASPSELEMSILSSGHSTRMIPDQNSLGSLPCEELEESLAVIPERLFRDPDHVDIPHLKSTSRVAVPVGSNPQETGHPDEVEYTFDAF